MSETDDPERKWTEGIDPALTTVRPALTAEEWDEVKLGGSVPPHWKHRRHAAAAIALYGQPFGFTAEDVAELRAVAAADARGPATFTAIADRIAALLPA